MKSVKQHRPAPGLRGRKSIALGVALLATLVLASCLIVGLRGPTTGPRRGQIISHPDNPYWLVRYAPNGNHTPVFLCGPGDPEGLLFKDTGASPETILEKMKAEGGNAIYVLAVRSHGGDGTPDQNPFIDQDPKMGIDPQVLKAWHKILKPFDRAGIAIHLFLYDDGAKPFGMGMGVVSKGEELFIEAVVNRFEDYKNVIWNIAEEYGEGMTAEHASEVARVIAKYDDHDHVIGISQNTGLDFHFEDDPRIGLWHIQSECESADNAHMIMGGVALRANQRYSLVYSEIYKYGYHLLQANDRTGLRHLAWAVAMAGVPVMHGGMWHPQWQPNPIDGILADICELSVNDVLSLFWRKIRGEQSLVADHFLHGAIVGVCLRLAFVRALPPLCNRRFLLGLV